MPEHLFANEWRPSCGQFRCRERQSYGFRRAACGGPHPFVLYIKRIFPAQTLPTVTAPAHLTVRGLGDGWIGGLFTVHSSLFSLIWDMNRQTPANAPGF